MVCSLQEGMPSDVFETVVDILDPELNIGSEANFDDDALIAKQRRKGESMTAEHGDHSMAELTTEQPTPTQITQVRPRYGGADHRITHAHADYAGETIAWRN